MPAQTVRLACLPIVASILLVAATRGHADDVVGPRLIVKLAASVDICLDCAVAEGRSLAPALGTEIDELNRRVGLRSARPIRRGDARMRSVASRRAAEANTRGRLLRGPPTRAPSTREVPSFAATYVLEFAPGTDVEEVARRYEKSRAVEWAARDDVVRVRLQPNDPYLGSSGAWGQSVPDLWGLHRIRAEDAWNGGTGTGVVIAIVDTGIDTTHPDIAANLWHNPGEVPGNGQDDDGNGYVDDVVGYDFIAGRGAVSDDHGHGTHTAGIAAAVGDNALGIAGVAFDSRVMALDVFYSGGDGTVSTVVEGVLYAIDNGARVINASWGTSSDNPALREAALAAHAMGVLLVAAAGNDGSDLDAYLSPTSFPALYNAVLTVGASDPLDARLDFSNYGTALDLLAPGGGDPDFPAVDERRRSILSLLSRDAAWPMTGSGTLVVGNRYVRQMGTSMAAPHVTGAAAVILSAHPEYGPEEVRQALRGGAEDQGFPGWDGASGAGRLDVAGALAVAQPTIAWISEPDHRSVLGDTASVRGTAAGADFASYTLEFAEAADGSPWTTIVGPVTSEVVDGELGVWDASTVAAGRHWIRLRVETTSGASFEDRVLVYTGDGTVAIDISSPRRWDLVPATDVLEIRGSAQVPDFDRYEILWGPYDPLVDPYQFISPLTADGITLAGNGLSPVVDGLLGTLDLSLLPGPRQVDIVLRVHTGSSYRDSAVFELVVDPTIRPGWPRELPTERLFSNRPPVRAPAIADIDLDGVKEVLVAAGTQVLVLRPDGSDAPGWPQPVWQDVSYSLETGPVSAADLDGDGLLEVMTSTEDRVFAFHHDGTLADGWPRFFPGVARADCTIADIDDDAVPEIVFTQKATGQLHAMHLDGTSVAGFPVSISIRGAPGDPGQSVSVADVTGDGRTEVVVVAGQPVSGPDPMWLFAFDGEGRVLPRFPRRLGRGAPNKDYAPVLADLDGDGVLDIAVGSSKPTKLRAFHGDGRTLRVSYKLPRTRKRKGDRQSPVSAADLDGDGAPEIFVGISREAPTTGSAGTSCDAYRDQLSAVRPGREGGQLADWPYEQIVCQNAKPFAFTAVTAADLDGDGVQEALVGSGHCLFFGMAAIERCSGLLVFDVTGQPLPAFLKPLPRYGSSESTPPAVGDLDGDGLMEIVWVHNGVDDFTGPLIPSRLIVWNVPGSPGPERGDWPMARHDAAHTGALRASPPR